MEALGLLNFVLKLFKICRNNIEILEQLITRELVQPSFEKRYILCNTVYDFELVKMISENENLIEYYLEATDGYSYKIELIFDGKWLLKSFLFQCVGCFGEDKECGVCGGSGWGVL